MEFFRQRVFVLLIFLMAMSHITEVVAAFMMNNQTIITLISTSEEHEEHETKKEQSAKDVFYPITAVIALENHISSITQPLNTTVVSYYQLFHSLPETPPPNFA